MQITAHISNSAQSHTVKVCTSGQSKPLSVAGRAGGGSSVNGGEFLMLALATCYCNDLYREAARLKIDRLQTTPLGSKSPCAGVVRPGAATCTACNGCSTQLASLPDGAPKVNA